MLLGSSRYVVLSISTCFGTVAFVHVRSIVGSWYVLLTSRWHPLPLPDQHCTRPWNPLAVFHCVCCLDPLYSADNVHVTVQGAGFMIMGSSTVTVNNCNINGNTARKLHAHPSTRPHSHTLRGQHCARPWKPLEVFSLRVLLGPSRCVALSISTCFGTVAFVHVLSNRGQGVCAAHFTMAPSALA